MNNKQELLAIIENSLIMLRNEYHIGQNDVKDITTMILNRINSCSRIKETARQKLDKFKERDSNIDFDDTSVPMIDTENYAKSKQLSNIKYQELKE